MAFASAMPSMMFSSTSHQAASTPVSSLTNRSYRPKTQPYNPTSPSIRPRHMPIGGAAPAGIGSAASHSQEPRFMNTHQYDHQNFATLCGIVSPVDARHTIVKATWVVKSTGASGVALYTIERSNPGSQSTNDSADGAPAREFLTVTGRLGHLYDPPTVVNFMESGTQPCRFAQANGGLPQQHKDQDQDQDQKTESLMMHVLNMTSECFQLRILERYGSKDRVEGTGNNRYGHFMQSGYVDWTHGVIHLVRSYQTMGGCGMGTPVPRVAMSFGTISTPLIQTRKVSVMPVEYMSKLSSRRPAQIIEVCSDADAVAQLSARADWYRKRGILDTSFDIGFHGTSFEAAQQIVQFGFRQTSSVNGKAFGSGVYFAKDPGYSLSINYAKPKNGMQVLLVAKFIRGKNTSSGNRTHSQDPLDSMTGGNGKNITVVWWHNAATDIVITHLLIFGNAGDPASNLKRAFNAKFFVGQYIRLSPSRLRDMAQQSAITAGAVSAYSPRAPIRHGQAGESTVMAQVVGFGKSTIDLWSSGQIFKVHRDLLQIETPWTPSSTISTMRLAARRIFVGSLVSFAGTEGTHLVLGIETQQGPTYIRTTNGRREDKVLENAFMLLDPHLVVDMRPRWFSHKLRPGCLVDCRDYQKKWHTGTIMSIKDGYAKVTFRVFHEDGGHFDPKLGLNFAGFGSEYDERLKIRKNYIRPVQSMHMKGSTAKSLDKLFPYTTVTDALRKMGSAATTGSTTSGEQGIQRPSKRTRH